MILRTEILQEKKLIGKSKQMSFANHSSFELWSSFMPCRTDIKNNVGSELYSIEIYPEGFFKNYNPQTPFTKWAAVEVKDFNVIPEGMETLIFPTGLYAVFLHRGPGSEGPKTYMKIFTQWFPNSEYEIDKRPHFAVMGEKYIYEDENSEEEIWIPVKLK